jgi:transposase
LKPPLLYPISGAFVKGLGGCSKNAVFAPPPVQRVLLESSGGYEQGVAQTLQQAGLPVMVVPAQRARHFAKSMRGDLKTDRVDAQLLAYFACCYPAPEATAVPEGQAQLRALWARREQLVQMLEAEKKRRQGAPETVRASLERLIAVLEEEIAQIEAEVAALMEADASLSQKAALLQTAVGVGAVVAYGLLAELPERVFENAVFAPSCRFPPLREGNRAEVRFPLPAGFPYCLRGTRKARFPLPAGFPYCLRGTRKARFPLPAGGT